MRGAALLMAFMLGLAGCGTVEPTSSATPRSSAAGGETCPLLDLQMTTGEPLDLTGAWRVTPDWSELYLYQRGSCLYGMGRSPGSDFVAPGSEGTLVTFLTIRPDLTIDGSLADVPVLPGAAELWRDDFRADIQFFEFGGAMWPAIHEFNPRSEDREREYSGYVFVPEATLSDRAEFVGTYGFDAPDCDWLEVDGERYALVQNPALLDREPAAWRLAAGQVIGPDGEVASAGDRLRVDGRVGPGLFRSGCQLAALLAWDLQPASSP